MIAAPYFDPALAVELPWEARKELMTYEDWCFVVDRFFVQEGVRLMTAPCLCDLSRCVPCDEAREAELRRTFPSSAEPLQRGTVPVGGGEKEKE